MLERRGVDAVIAQGSEAGGHRATFTGVDIGMQSGLFSLLPQVIDAVSVPVIAAGGIAEWSHRSRSFHARRERRTARHGLHALRRSQYVRRAPRRPGPGGTLVTDLISGRPARYIKNKPVDDLLASGLRPLPIPVQLGLTFPLGAAGDRNLSGQSAALAEDTNAPELVERLAEETGRRLRAFA
jgi:nitronate monooxygenase